MGQKDKKTPKKSAKHQASSQPTRKHSPHVQLPQAVSSMIQPASQETFQDTDSTNTSTNTIPTTPLPSQSTTTTDTSPVDLDVNTTSSPPPTPGREIDLQEKAQDTKPEEVNGTPLVDVGEVVTIVPPRPQDDDINAPAQSDGTDLEEMVDTDDPGTRHVNLPRRVERELGEWLEANAFLYDRGATEYKNTAKKKRTLENKAKSLTPPLTGAELQRWINTKRTKYGRLTKAMAKSGAGAIYLTELDQWVLQLFGFLGKHIVRQKDPKTLGLRKVC